MGRIIELLQRAGLFAENKGDGLIRVTDDPNDDSGPAYWFAVHEVPANVDGGVNEMVSRVKAWIKDGKQVTGKEEWA